MAESKAALHSRLLAEVVRWSVGGGVGPGPGILVEGTNEACPGLPCPGLPCPGLPCGLPAPASPLLLLLGAGTGLYLLGRGLQLQQGGDWARWLTKPAAPSPLPPATSPLRGAEPPAPPRPSTAEDRSLNSLSTPSTPRKLLTRPLYVASRRPRHVLTRAGLPGLLARARPPGDGGERLELLPEGKAEDRAKQGEDWALQGELRKAARRRPSSALFLCGRGEPDGRDWSRASSACGSRAGSPGRMGEVVRQAREVRRLIREQSWDSLASDLGSEWAGWAGEEAGEGEGGEGLEGGEEEATLRPEVLGDCRAAWRLMGPGSCVSEDWGSEAGSLDPWEWDNEGCWEEGEQGLATALLPDTLQELDMEAELAGGRRATSRSSTESDGSEDITLSAPPD
jgi:hypothetical protein